MKGCCSTATPETTPFAADTPCQSRLARYRKPHRFTTFLIRTHRSAAPRLARLYQIPLYNIRTANLRMKRTPQVPSKRAFENLRPMGDMRTLLLAYLLHRLGMLGDALPTRCTSPSKALASQAPSTGSAGHSGTGFRTGHSETCRWSICGWASTTMAAHGQRRWQMPHRMQNIYIVDTI